MMKKKTTNLEKRQKEYKQEEMESNNYNILSKNKYGTQK